VKGEDSNSSDLRSNLNLRMKGSKGGRKGKGEGSKPLRILARRGKRKGKGVGHRETPLHAKEGI